jgi:Spy/CpxP family protein refolding chaperone
MNGETMRFTSMLTTVALAASFALPLAAQNAPGGPPAGAQQQGAQNGDESRFQEINKAAGLTPEQQTQVRALLQKSMSDLDKLRKEEPAWNDAAKAKIDQIWVREKAAILEVLTPEQKPKYEAYFKHWTEERAKDKH